MKCKFWWDKNSTDFKYHYNKSSKHSEFVSFKWFLSSVAWFEPYTAYKLSLNPNWFFTDVYFEMAEVFRKCTGKLNCLLKNSWSIFRATVMAFFRKCNQGIKKYRLSKAFLYEQIKRIETEWHSSSFCKTGSKQVIFYIFPNIAYIWLNVSLYFPI